MMCICGEVLLEFFLNRLISSKVTQERLRQPAPVVSCHTTVWFKQEIPGCSFVTWIAMSSRLPSRDRLLSWGLTVLASCVLCMNGTESHGHLFFHYAFAVGLWNIFTGNQLDIGPSDFLDSVDCMTYHRTVQTSSSCYCNSSCIIYGENVTARFSDKLPLLLRRFSV